MGRLHSKCAKNLEHALRDEYVRDRMIVHTFNAGTGLSKSRGETSVHHEDANVTAHLTLGYPISEHYSSIGKVIRHKAITSNSHTISNYLEDLP